MTWSSVVKRELIIKPRLATCLIMSTTASPILILGRELLGDITIAFVFSELNCNLLATDQCDMPHKSSLIRSLISCTTRRGRDRYIWGCLPTTRSLMKILNRMGPNIEPGGTPALTRLTSEKEEPIFTYWHRLSR